MLRDTFLIADADVARATMDRKGQPDGIAHYAEESVSKPAAA